MEYLGRRGGVPSRGVRSTGMSAAWDLVPTEEECIQGYPAARGGVLHACDCQAEGGGVLHAYDARLTQGSAACL